MVRRERPKMLAGEPRTVQFHMRLTRSERAKVEAWAESVGLTAAEAIRRLVADHLAKRAGRAA